MSIYDSIFASLNIAASLGIIVMLARNRKIVVESNRMVSVGYCLMAMFSATILLKATYNLSMDELKSDVYGILFRCAFLLYWVGSTRAATKYGVNVQMKTEGSVCVVSKPLTEAEPLRTFAKVV